VPPPTLAPLVFRATQKTHEVVTHCSKVERLQDVQQKVEGRKAAG